MNPEERDILYKLFRDHEEVMGVSRTSVVALQSYRRALLNFKHTDNNDFRNLVLELNEVIKNTEPKIIPLIHLIEEFEAELQPHFDKPFEEMRDRALEILTQKISRIESNIQGVIENGMQVIAENDFIVVQSPSLVIRSVLKQAHSLQHKNFKVLILEQHFTRIKQLISELSQVGVAHLVVPDYNLSHFLKTATKLFIGAVSVTPDAKVVTTIGTANVVGLCHLNRIPTYLLVSLLKFAHQTISKQHIHKVESQVSRDNLTYRHATYSHDMVDLHLIDHVITEKGEIDTRSLFPSIDD